MASVEAPIYLETSAAAKLLVEEPESASFASWMDERRPCLSSLLVETERRRLAQRVGFGQEHVADLLDRLDLIEPDATTFGTAGLLHGPRLRSLDALHVAAALRAGCEAMISRDPQHAKAARAAGLHVLAPA